MKINFLKLFKDMGDSTNMNQCMHVYGLFAILNGVSPHNICCTHPGGTAPLTRN